VPLVPFNSIRDGDFVGKIMVSIVALCEGIEWLLAPLLALDE
jgi:hypothetical protein